MNKRDTDILSALVPKLTARATASTRRTSLIVSGGEARAIEALIREWVRLKAEAPVEKPAGDAAQGGLL